MDTSFTRALQRPYVARDVLGVLLVLNSSVIGSTATLKS